jgi:membrane fusion protein (multidrug efflux system)
MYRYILYPSILLLLLNFSSCKEAKTNAPKKAEYKLLSLKKEKRTNETSYSASIKGKQDIEIYPQVSGYLRKIAVSEGQHIQKGDVLFIIEQAPYKAAYEAAKAKIAVETANVANAKLNYENTLALKEKKIVSDAEVTAKKNELNSAKAQLQLAESEKQIAKTNLDFTLIKSPVNGVVGKLPYRNGTLVSPSIEKCLTVVSDNSEMYVYFSMNENKIHSLINKYGSLNDVVSNMSSVQLILNNGSIYGAKGKIESISGVIEENTGSLSIRAVFPNENQKLLSGSVGNILLTEEFNDVISIPKTATFEMQDKVCVYRVIDNKTRLKIIEVSKSKNDQEFIVTKGLEVGDVIIAEGAGLVKENTLVINNI